MPTAAVAAAAVVHASYSFGANIVPPIWLRRLLLSSRFPKSAGAQCSIHDDSIAASGVSVVLHSNRNPQQQSRQPLFWPSW
jgi:hypothetical protein